MDTTWPEKLASGRKRVIDELMEGRELANQLQSVLLSKSDGDGSSSAVSAAEDLVVKIMESFSNTLFILNVNEGDDDVSVSQIQANSHVGSACLDARKSEDSDESCRSISNVKDRRGCYKRRRASPTWKNETPTLIDDGYAWRKYGQKVILNAQYPRNYYRCTHKYDQQCQATKQVQRIQEEPQLFRTTYHGHHTCRNLRAPELMLDCTNITTPGNRSSALISFDGSNGSLPNKHGQQEHPFLSTFSSIKQEFKEEEIPCDINHNQSSSSEYFMPHDLKGFESQRPMAVLSSSLDSDHGDGLSGVMDPVDFDDEILQFEF
ncbi:WRKY DNA-binding transcription factor 70 [Ziziphus jujuba]|uniref:WRKY DNA-binding transcription factor 70 n=2 Tax=Ziziphus jujuba TaxID=326968 RepID=A0A6P4B5H6_ZIZJJ|nr:WRKY DNA-binding transcription factor 70 [Ziziphus jujuba]KAH7514776.1 hypothetical protein FEM48_Zijuj11G0126300 [Ziziphus jujuba var. spinosa]